MLESEREKERKKMQDQLERERSSIVAKIRDDEQRTRHVNLNVDEIKRQNEEKIKEERRRALERESEEAEERLFEMQKRKRDEEEEKKKLNSIKPIQGGNGISPAAARIGGRPSIGNPRDVKKDKIAFKIGSSTLF
eukprot:GHVU01224173.1.p3 GENE.GHVU01224173.1~~GHVU01224173.1.p3  ORF type:complete len:136 (+),score=38.23 GHVU01224173.1:1563-1970(+)